MLESENMLRFIRFVVVGGCAFLAYTGALLLATHQYGTGQVYGVILAFMVGTLVSYAGNSRFVFYASPNAGNLIRFLLVTFAGLGLNVGLAYVLERGGSPPLLTASIIFAIVPIINYSGHQVWTFRKRPTEVPQ